MKHVVKIPILVGHQSPPVWGEYEVTLEVEARTRERALILLQEALQKVVNDRMWIEKQNESSAM